MKDQQKTTIVVQERFSQAALDILCKSLKNGIYCTQWATPGGRTLQCHVKVWRGTWKCVHNELFGEEE